PEPPNPDQRQLNLTPITPATLPRVTVQPRPGLPTPHWSDTALIRPKRRHNTLANPRLREPGRAHDRFLSPREVTTPLSDRFRAIKEPHELSVEERLTRNDEATPDPFRQPPRPDYLALRDRRTSRSDGHNRRSAGTVLAMYPSAGASDLERQVSAGSMWTVGGMAPAGGSAVDTGRGLLLESGTNAPLYRAPFASGRPRSSEDNERHEGRLAQALDINRAQRVLAYDNFSTFPRCKRKVSGQHFIPRVTTTWTGTEWVNDTYTTREQLPPINNQRPFNANHLTHMGGLENIHSIPNEPFRVLDATGLRDDYYCSVMSFCSNCDVIAVGLGNCVYGWSETSEVSLLNKGRSDGTWVSSLSFSSEGGLNSILACGRSNGTVSLVSLLDSEGADELPPVFAELEPGPYHSPFSESQQPWRSRPDGKPSGGRRCWRCLLLLGRMASPPWEAAEDNYRGSMTLLACIKAHSQQICGLAWSSDGSQFATGGNDNLCCLYNTNTIAETEPVQDDALPDVSTFQWSAASDSVLPHDSILDNLGVRDVVNLVTPIRNSRPPPTPSTGANASTPAPLRSSVLSLGLGDRNQHNNLPAAAARASINLPKMHSRSAALKVWRHQAAVKALAFCPWQPNLLATGGGSTDKMIHFFHTTSGAALATISVSAQVTSLTWSTRRRELAATFGYAQPDHSVRIAVFSWPECAMIGCVRWHGEHRALCAIAYPGGPRGLHSQEFAESGPSSRTSTRAARTSYSRRRSKPKRDGCLVVAGSDESVKFHEVWGMGAGALSTSLGSGALGGSDILEMAEGIDKEGDVIR
ncbi:hypothetical protein PG993_008435, partial [Apiospora rasikravindrae]